MVSPPGSTWMLPMFLLLSLSLSRPVVSASSPAQGAESPSQVLESPGQVDGSPPQVRTRGKPPPGDASIIRKVVKFKPLKLPQEFSHYDVDGDGGVQLTELARVTGTSVDDCGPPFEVADTDKNGIIDINEFENAPWRLDGKREKHRKKKEQQGRKKKKKQQET